MVEFNIWREGRAFRLTDGCMILDGFGSEGEAIAAAVSIALGFDALYSISYWKP